ncbi:MAG: twin-arginine translocase TatA/TatE family subunit [Kofleriaceae bacterium]|nr:twin-arginine translocase TatA/TatE family subunit [Kofleriaceae bacterium]
MFGMGGTEIIVILIVALIFLGPDKLPEAAKSISKGIRDLKRSTRDIQETFEADEQFGGAIRDIKSALRGEDAPVRPKKNLAQASAIAVANGVASDDDDDDEVVAGGAAVSVGTAIEAGNGVASNADDTLPVTQPEPVEAAAGVTALATPVAAASMVSLPAVVGQAAAASTLSASTDEDRAADAAVAAMIRPAPGAIAKGSVLSDTDDQAKKA